MLISGLNPYYVNDSPDPWAGSTVLVFHYTARQAKALGFRHHPGCPDSYDWIYFRVHRAPDLWHAFRKEDGPHVIDDFPGPRKCECQTWGGFLRHYFDPCGIHNYECTYV